MAKVKSSGLRNYVGRLGGSVYYMLKGQNIAREKAPEVSNPRTAVQMRQRMQWANLVAMYKFLQPYLGKKAFQNKPAIWSDYNAFMSANLGLTPVYLTKEAVQNGVAYLAPYKVTEGSLPAIGGSYRESSNAFDTNLSLGGDMVFDETTTISQLAERIISNNAGWQSGDQLGIIIMQNGRMYRPYTHAFEFILDPSDVRTITELIDYDDLFLSHSGNLSIDVDVLDNPTQGLAKAIAVIHSRTISGKTSVSTQYLALNVSAMTEYRDKTTEDAFNDARESYGIPTEVWLDAGYQGETGEPAALALASVAEEVTTDADSKIELMNVGSKNKFFDPTIAGDVIGDCYLIFRFNRNHGWPENYTVNFSYDKDGTSGITISYKGTPAIKGNYVRINVSDQVFSGLKGGAITLHIKTEDGDYDMSLTA